MILAYVIIIYLHILPSLAGKLHLVSPNGLFLCQCTALVECVRGFPGGSVVKTLPADAGEAGDVGLIPG